MRLLALISGGIDSPVAAHMMLSRGHEVDGIHFDNQPFTDDKQMSKAIDLAKRLSGIHNGDMRLVVVPQGDALVEIAREAPQRLACVLCRRMMLRVASMIAERDGYEGLVTGESLGQVASQTLDNILVEEGAATVPVIRPLIGLDKTEITGVAKEVGTYEISTSPGLCCTMVPDKPATRAKLADVLKAEEKVDVGPLANAVFDRAEECELGEPRGCS